MELIRPRAILFDWDNTLVNTWPIIHNALHQTFVEMGHEPWPMETTRANVRHSMRDSFPRIFGEGWEKASSIYQKFYQATHLVHLEALPGAEKTLRKVREAGWYSAVVSNKRNVNLHKEIGHIGWGHYFDRLVGADDAERDKPHPEPVYMALEGSGIAPGRDVWFIGDSSIDLECAKATGCNPVLYGDFDVEPVEDGTINHQGFPFTAHVRTHDALLDIISRFHNAAA